MKNLVFLGPPGAGKGTQASLMSQRFGIAHISTGEMLRAAIRQQTPIGLQAKSFMDAGALVPDEVVIGIVKERIAQDDCKNGYILDGFPRTIHQAQELDKIADITMAINIAVEDEKLVKRLSGRRVCGKCGFTSHVDAQKGDCCPTCGEKLIQRDDDKPETIRNRLAVYNKSTQPLIDYYRNKGLLKEVDGFMGISDVTKAIAAAIEG